MTKSPKLFTVRLTAGEALTIWRQRARCRLAEIATHVGVSRQTMGEIEAGRVDPAPEYRQRIMERTSGFVAPNEWALRKGTEKQIDAGELFGLLLRRKDIPQKAVCIIWASGEPDAIHETRVSGIIRGQVWPCDREQAIIAALFPKLKGAWRTTA